MGPARIAQRAGGRCGGSFCALPGIFPPREINGQAYVDGAVVENLPVRMAASLGQGPILAINVAATSVLRSETETQGFAATYIRGLEIVMQTQIEAQLRDWKGPPLVLVQPGSSRFRCSPSTRPTS